MEQTPNLKLYKWSQTDKKLDTISKMANNMDVIDTQLSDLAYNVKAFGLIADGVADNTLLYNDMITKIPAGSIIKFPKGTYKGNFVSNKSFHLDFDGSTLIPATNDTEAVKFNGSELAPVDLVGNPVYGDLTFTLLDASGLAKNDIGVLYDSEMDVGGSSEVGINSEVIKIREIVGNTVHVYDKIRSNQSTGTVKFKKINPLINPTVKNLHVQCTDTFTKRAVAFDRCESPKAERISTDNGYGIALSFERSYDIYFSDVTVKKPRETTSGKGYGVGCYKCRRITGKDIYGYGTRHIYDSDASYDINVENIYEYNAKSAPVSPVHNGYGGLITIKNVFVNMEKEANYAVTFTNQSLANLNSQTLSDVLVENVNMSVGALDDVYYLAGVNIRHNYKDVRIEKVTIKTKATQVHPLKNGVRILGQQKGSLEIRGVDGDFLEQGVYIEQREADATDTYLTKLKDIFVGQCKNIIKTLGVKNLNIDGAYTNGITEALFAIEPKGVENTKYLVVSPALKVIGTPPNSSAKVFSTNTQGGFLGQFPLTTPASSGLAVVNGDSVPIDTLIRSSKLLKLVAPTDSDCALNATTPFGKPLFEGQEVFVCVNSPNYVGTRGNVIIPGGSTTFYNTTALTLEKGKTYKIMAQGGKWYLTN